VYFSVQSWPGQMRAAPASAWSPSEKGARNVKTRPPGRIRASRMTTSCPALACLWRIDTVAVKRPKIRETRCDYEL